MMPGLPILMLLLLGMGACASGTDSSSASGTYLRWVTFEAAGHEHVLLRWQKRQMPLRVHLPKPPPGMFEDREAIYESVRDGVLDWEGVAGPGLPRFEFVESPGDANIPIVWGSEPDGDWYIAKCSFDLNLRQRRFGVSRILVTAKWGGNRVADSHDVHAVMLHEMGHALGFGGHSPDSGDIMYPAHQPGSDRGLSDRDRRTLEALYARPSGSRMAGAKRFR